MFSMQSLTIYALSADSARAMAAALGEFRCARSEANGKHELVVTFRNGDQDLVQVLSTLASHITELGDGAARVEFEGRRYTMMPER
jgi:hypothetical protein